MKITGAHDENDYGVAQRNNIPMYRLMDERASDARRWRTIRGNRKAQALEIAKSGKCDGIDIDAMNLVPDELRGLDRYEARKAVVKQITDEGLAVTRTVTKTVTDADGNKSEIEETVPYVERTSRSCSRLATAPALLSSLC